MPRQRDIQFGAKSLDRFISENMYHSEFEAPETSGLGWTKTALTRACNNPELLSMKRILQLSVFFFGTEEKAGLFINSFNCGKQTITIDQAEKYAP